jgi:hypothetical protein
MYLLHRAKEWFSNLFKPKQGSFENPHTDENTPSTPVEYSGPDIRFYTENYKITDEAKKRLVKLIQYPEFKDFETYMDWRINASAHRMKSLLLDHKDEQARAEAAAIDSLVRIPADMQNFWLEVKMMDMEKEIIVMNKKQRKPKLYGKDAVSLGAE